MANNKLQPPRSINYRWSQFSKIFRSQLVSAYELILILKLITLQNVTLKPKKTTIAIIFSLQSAQQCQYVF